MPKQTKVSEANESLATKDKKTTKADSPEKQGNMHLEKGGGERGKVRGRGNHLADNHVDV